MPDCGVETPCATCGGTGIYTIRARHVTVYNAPCPDCEVETPEAAVEAGARALVEKVGGNHVFQTDIDRARAVLDAAKPHLIAQGWTPPGTRKDRDE